jgi:hypothetical protein
VDQLAHYQIEVKDRLNQNDLDAFCQYQSCDFDQAMCATRLTIHTDQSALVGLIRNFHARGVVLLSIIRGEEAR